MTPRPNDEQKRVLDVRAENAARSARADGIRELSQDGRERYAALLGRLAK